MPELWQAGNQANRDSNNGSNIESKKRQTDSGFGADRAGQKGEHKNIFENISKAGYLRARVDGVVMELEEAFGLNLDKYKKHNIEVVVDRLVAEPKMDRARVANSVETALRIGEGLVIVASDGEKDAVFSEHFACPDCGISISEIEPRSFSFNSPHGACPVCSGLGKQQKKLIPI